MMRHRTPALLILLTIAAACAIAAPAVARTAASDGIDAALEGAPVKIACPFAFPQACWDPTDGNAAYATVSVPVRPEAIELLCFHLTFRGDLLDPGDRGERVEIRYPGTWGFGVQNATSHALKKVAICLGAGDPAIDPFLDGSERITVFMAEGTAKLAAVDVDVTFAQA